MMNQSFEDLDLVLDDDGVITLYKTTNDGVRELVRIPLHGDEDTIHGDIAAGMALIMKADLRVVQQSFACFWIGAWFMDMCISEVLEDRGFGSWRSGGN